jgi:hypothetical protein
VICPPCAEAADAERLQDADLRALGPDLYTPPIGHPPETCRDHAIQPGGCGCQHQPVSTATDQPRET